jgi:ABC-type branched-subunit amino acid transport system substrate-binding protein
MAVAGSFPDVSFPDLIQFYCMSKKTVAIRVTCPDLPEASGEFFVADGELLDAKLGDRTGVDAFYRALQIHRGSFEVQVDVRPPTRSIHLPLNAVLLQGMTHMDEAGRSGAHARAPSHREFLDRLEEAFQETSTQPPLLTGPNTQPLVRDGEETEVETEEEARRRKVVGLVIVGSALVLGIASMAAVGFLRPGFRAAGEQTASAPAPNPAGTAEPSGLAFFGRGTASAQGITDDAILFGMAAPFTGPAKELGRQTRVGIELAFAEANAGGGIHGRKLTLTVEDDAFDPSRVGAAMHSLWDRKKVFSFLGNVGSAAAGTAGPFAVERRTLLFGAFSGSAILRREPPDRYVFNYRASDAEEMAAVFNYLLKGRGLHPEQIAVFTEDDASGEAGFQGVAKVLRQLRRDPRTALRVTYPRNTLDVDGAVVRIRNHTQAIRAVVMAVPYRPAARFIEKMRAALPGLVFTNVSSVGASALAEELLQSGPGASDGVIVTQVVPPFETKVPAVMAYQQALAKHLPDERPDAVSFEAWLSTRVLLAALQPAGRTVDVERLVDALESLRDLDLGTGALVSLGPSEHQASHRVWGTVLDARGHYQLLPLD